MQQGVATVVEGFPRHPHHKPQKTAAALRVPFHGVVRGGNPMDFHPAHGQGFRGIQFHQPVRHVTQPLQHQGPVRPGYHQFGGRIGGKKGAEGVRIQMVGVVM